MGEREREIERMGGVVGEGMEREKRKRKYIIIIIIITIIK